MASNSDTYKYTPSSSHATRAVLEQTQIQTSSPSNPTSASEPKEASFRPQVFRRKSTNYADADAAAREATASSQQRSLPQEDGQADGRPVPEDKNATGTGGGSVAWKPAFGRKQSWNHQDLKHTMQMSLVTDAAGDTKGLKGFSEGKSG